MNRDIQDLLGDRYRENEPMSLHTTFRVGGNAKGFAQIDSIEELIGVLEILNSTNEKYFLVGNGSNLLVSDKGYDGIVLHFSKKMSYIELGVDGLGIRCGAGATLAMVAKFALEHSLGGFEFAAGIPGTIGGAVVMNAGAYDGEMRQVVSKVEMISPQGTLEQKYGKDMDFSYRHSILKDTHKDYIVTGVEIGLEKKPYDDIKARMEELAAKRRDKQPLEYPSAGSTFKRPEGYFAAKLIDDAGLRGYSVGGACVSEKHCGFVINKGDATASDIYRLMQDVADKVYESSGVRLEPEVILLGF